MFEDRALSYAELDAHANRLAHHLQSLGVGPETIVGLLVERSPEMVVGLLGILKAGGAYLPLDPNYPRERLAFMLADAGAPGAGDASGAARAAARGGVRRSWCGSTPTGRRSRASPTPRRRSTSIRDHPAYVIYTSGSTGTPKGRRGRACEASPTRCWRLEKTSTCGRTSGRRCSFPPRSMRRSNRRCCRSSAAARLSSSATTCGNRRRSSGSSLIEAASPL